MKISVSVHCSTLECLNCFFVFFACHGHSYHVLSLEVVNNCKNFHDELYAFYLWFHFVCDGFYLSLPVLFVK